MICRGCVGKGGLRWGVGGGYVGGGYAGGGMIGVEVERCWMMGVCGEVV